MSPSRSWSRFSRFSWRSGTKRHRGRSLELTTRSVTGVGPLGVRLAPATRDRARVGRARLAALPGAASARAQRAAHDADLSLAVLFAVSGGVTPEDRSPGIFREGFALLIPMVAFGVALIGYLVTATVARARGVRYSLSRQE